MELCWALCYAYGYNWSDSVHFFIDSCTTQVSGLSDKTEIWSDRLSDQWSLSIELYVFSGL